MKVKKRFLIVILLIMFLVTSILSVNVSAADSNYSFTVTMTANNTKVEPGSEVLVAVKVSNLNAGDNGINGFSAILSYDTDLFEPLTESSVDGVDGWKASYEKSKVQLYKDKYQKTDGEIMQISLKTKADVAVGTQGDIKLSTIKASNSVDEIGTKDVSTSITIGNGNDSGTVIPINNTPTNNPIPIQPNNNTTQTPVNIVPTNNSIVRNTTTDNVVDDLSNETNTSNGIQVVNESDDDMPYTGTDSDALARIIIGVIFIALVMYIKIERMNKDIK